MLQFWILYLLAEKPSNGSEIMEDMVRRSRGHWKPSPGSVYPALSKMESSGFISKNEDNTYRLTDNGRKELNEYEVLVKGLFEQNNENKVIEETLDNMKHVMDAYDRGVFSELMLEHLDMVIEKYKSMRSGKS